jgi:hypothetical protein
LLTLIDPLSTHRPPVDAVTTPAGGAAHHNRGFLAALNGSAAASLVWNVFASKALKIRIFQRGLERAAGSEKSEFLNKCSASMPHENCSSILLAIQLFFDALQGVEDASHRF